MSSDSNRWLKLKSGAEIRGAESLLTDECAEKFGYAFALWLADSLGMTPDQLKIAVGHDPRASAARLRRALIRGITAADSDVLDCGMCAEAALFRMIDDEYRAQGAIMITAAFKAADQNGFRCMTQNGNISEADIAQLLKNAAACEVPDRLVKPADASGRYQAYLAERMRVLLEDDALKPLLGLSVVVDAGNGTGGFFAGFLESLGADTYGSLNLEPDGAFPAHLPDTQDEQALASLRAAVLENEADLGVLLDANCDRVAIVGGDGSVYDKDRLIALISAILLSETPGATIVTDSVTSSGLSRFISEWGGIHYRFKRGYRNVIEEAKRLNREGIDCPLAIETSGHAAFRENRFISDGIYMAARVICEALERKRQGETLNDLVRDLPQSVESCEIRLPIPDEDSADEACRAVVEAVLSHTLEDPAWEVAPDSREGVRILFNLDGGIRNAWFQLRKSVHECVMPLNAESDVPGGVQRILSQLYEVIGSLSCVDTAPLRDYIGLSLTKK